MGASLLFSHGFVKLTAREGNTPLHLAMESAHGETAALLIEAGADRSRVSHSVETNVLLLLTYVSRLVKSR